MMNKVSFTAIFLEEDSASLLLENGERLENIKSEMHVTLSLGNSKLVSDDWMGKRVKLIVDGRGMSDTNEGYRVILPEEILAMYSQMETRVPHITVSLSKEGRAKDTKDLVFQPISPFVVRGRMGLQLSNGEIIFDRNEIS